VGNGREPKLAFLPVLVGVFIVLCLGALAIAPGMSHEAKDTASSAVGEKQKPIPKVVDLSQGDSEYLRVLAGPPESCSMRSGRVVLQPSRSVGRHSTEDYEEVVVVLEGEGELLLEDGSVLPLHAHMLGYVPPGTKHDVRNTGAKPLCYVYIVCKARGAGARHPT
jgi:oxalate decarboxylase/phosphoglucose isomerase-like protein (cupin superfamily)